MTQNLDEFVRLVAQEKDSAARQKLFRAVKNIEFFFPVELEKRGDKVVRRAPLLQLSDGTHAMMMYTSKSHPDLPHKVGTEFGGGSFRDALAAASRIPTLDWVVVSNLESEWFSIHKAQLKTILADLDWQGLEDLISRASNSSAPEQLLPSIRSAITGREVFLEMAGEHLATFRMNDMPMLRAYLTRKRPGIVYGGMSWEALKEMMNKLPGIQGVQIFNDADDWILFDRAALDS